MSTAPPFDSGAPYPTGSLEDNLVQTVAWQLADEGDLDLDATIDTWLPDVPNADRVTIGMLADYTTGWNRVDKETPIVADLSRRWTLAEVMEGMLDLLDALVAGDLFTTDRTPGPDRFLDARLLDGSVYGLGIPLNGYCPCESAGGDTLNVAAVGRRPHGLGTNVTIVRFPDGISVVLQFNSDSVVDKNDIWQVVLAIHDTAVQS